MSSTIKQAIEALKSRIADAYTAIVAKGGTLPATQDSANLPSAIASIPSGSGSPYDDLAQLGISQDFIDEITNLEKPSAEDIAAATPYMNLSGTGFRRLGPNFNLKYIPPYMVTDFSIEQHFWGCIGVEILGEIKATTGRKIRYAMNFCNASNFNSVLQYIEGEELDLSECSSIIQAFFNNPCLRRIPRILLPAQFNNSYDMYRTFSGCRSLKEIDFGTSTTATASNMREAFDGCFSLITIKGTIDMTSNLSNNYRDIFRNCIALTNVKIKNCGGNLNMSKSTNLSYESLLYLVQNVKNVSEYTLTIGSTNIAKLNATAEGQAAISTAQSYGWTIA